MLPLLLLFLLPPAHASEPHWWDGRYAWPAQFGYTVYPSWTTDAAPDLYAWSGGLVAGPASIQVKQCHDAFSVDISATPFLVSDGGTLWDEDVPYHSADEAGWTLGVRVGTGGSDMDGPDADGHFQASRGWLLGPELRWRPTRWLATRSWAIGAYFPGSSLLTPVVGTSVMAMWVVDIPYAWWIRTDTGAVDHVEATAFPLLNVQVDTAWAFGNDELVGGFGSPTPNPLHARACVTVGCVDVAVTSGDGFAKPMIGFGVWANLLGPAE